MKNLLIACVAVLGIGLASPLAHATLLAPGTQSATADTFSITSETLIASIQNAALAPPGGSVGQTIFGTYSAWVYQEAGGTLDFLYQVNSTTSTTVVNRITASNFGAFTTDVGYVSSGPLPPSASSGGVLPGNGSDTIDRSADGNTVGWNFQANGGIGAGANSVVLEIQTNATLSTAGILSVIDSTTSSNVAFEPTVVPEPSTMAIAGIGALGMIGYGLRRRKALGA